MGFASSQYLQVRQHAGCKAPMTWGSNVDDDTAADRRAGGGNTHDTAVTRKGRHGASQAHLHPTCRSSRQFRGVEQAQASHGLGSPRVYADDHVVGEWSGHIGQHAQAHVEQGGGLRRAGLAEEIAPRDLIGAYSGEIDGYALAGSGVADFGAVRFAGLGCVHAGLMGRPQPPGRYSDYRRGASR